MLFRKKIEGACEYCTYSTPLNDHSVWCSKKGVKEHGEKCRRFQYDPCKRVPSKPKALDFSKYEEYDYSL